MPVLKTEQLAPEFLRTDPESGVLRRRTYQLSVSSGPLSGQKLRLSGTIRVGSDPSCDLHLDDPSISRHHLEIETSAAGVRLKDLKSTNGTLVGGARIDEALIEQAATITLGRTQLSISIEEEDLGELVSDQGSFGAALGESAPMRHLFGMLERLAKTDTTVLLWGETGTGKEVLAENLHQHSLRAAKGQWVVVDCGAVAPSLIESELFGHVKGAFTGAISDRKGSFLEANGGTLMLDEIGELPLEIQPKLLRFLETGTFKRVGEDKPRKVDVRIVAATHRNLRAEVEKGRFRQDLYFRLAVVEVRVPPLRERPDDIPLLCRDFVRKQGGDQNVISLALIERLKDHSWPGNVRELRNVVQRALSGIGGDPLEASTAGLEPSTPAMAPPTPGPRITLQLPFKEAKDQQVEAFTKEYLAALLAQHKGNLSAVARAAHLNRNYVRELVVRYGLKADSS